MKVLFVTGNIFFSEPHGLLALSAACIHGGHETRLVTLTNPSFSAVLDEYDPDFIAYSAMSPEMSLFEKADKVVLRHAADCGKHIPRIMGGPHATHFPEVLDELGLDSVCIGEGDYALPSMLERHAAGEGFDGIPNIMTSYAPAESITKELVCELDALPFPDRTLYFNAAPHYRMLGIPGVMTSRGCPYNCTYCHNHAFNNLFKGLGKIVRRKSPRYVIEETEKLIKEFGPVKMIRFCDDTFAHIIDDWLLEFLPQYKNKIGLPFYCLMRSNTLSDDMGKLLAEHGCISIGMSVESGDERTRNELLRRNLTDEKVIHSFMVARKYGLKTFGNTMVALPGTTSKDDYRSFLFTKSLKMSVPTFGIFSPFPRTELTDFAIRAGLLDSGQDHSKNYYNETPLKNYTQEEKDMQVNMSYLGTLFCALPTFFDPAFRQLIRMRPNILFKFAGIIFMSFKMAKDIFPVFFRRNVFYQIRVLLESLRFLIARKKETL